MGNTVYRIFFCKVALLSCLLSTAYGSIIHVPQDYSTIKNAVSNALPGDVILIAPGTYLENKISINKRLTIASWYYTTGDEQYISQTVVDGGGDNVFTTIRSQGINVEISGLKFINSYKPIIIHDLVAIKRNIFFGNKGDTISFEAFGYGYVGYNTIEQSGDDGIDIDGRKGRYYTIEHNTIRNCRDDGIEIRLSKYEGPTMKYTINNNTFFGNLEDGIQLIDYDDVVSNRVFSISNNVFANNAMAGLGCMANRASGENYAGSSMKERVYFYNNTVVGNVVGVTGGDNMIVLNNIIANNTNVGIKGAKVDSVVGYNIFYQNGTHIQNSVTSEPLFLDVDPKYDANYRLLDGSPCIDSGTIRFEWNSEVVLDLLPPSSNGSVPDLGAYEH
ncbi:MAG: right-handed parallel beta-helix repeat-containing protein [Candidatus Jettenia sp.]|nr:right-handed parallel beta-helix repeat-containing protein [Candidatus Jettenia sp.]